MPEGGYFLKMTGAVLLGLITLGIATAAVILFSNDILAFVKGILPFLVGAVLIIAAVIIIWIILYIAAIVGVAIYYVIRHPMEVSKKHGDYDMEKVKESGKRQKGDSRGEKTEEKNEEE